MQKGVQESWPRCTLQGAPHGPAERKGVPFRLRATRKVLIEAVILGDLTM